MRCRAPSTALSDSPLHTPQWKRGFTQRQLNRMRAALPGVLLALFLLLSWVGRGQQQRASPVRRLLASNSSAASDGTTDADADYFVRVEGGRFVVGPSCRPFYLAGWNQWEMVEAGAGALELFGASLPPNTTGPALVRLMLDRAAANRMNVVRGWAHSVTAQYALQTAPGQYSEAVFRGLDYALDEARKRGIRVLLSLTDNWQQTGGADEFVRWAGAGSHEDFFTDAKAKQLYKDHVAAVLQRVNSINGRRYSQDPTIFGWNLINEPRCYQCGNVLQLWVNEMAAYVKSLDSNHLLTVGEEGFYPAGPEAANNPQGAQSWANTEGQDFVADHASPDIDFLAFHLWVNNWEDKSPQFAQRWIQAHIADAQAAGKPLILEEFGVWDGNRAEHNDYYRLILDAVAQNAQAGGPAMGALFWTWYAEGQRAPAEEGGTAAGLFGVFESDQVTWPIIRSFSDAMAALRSGNGSSSRAACTDGGSLRGAAAAPECTASQVGGREGTGYEGPGCNIDINECVRGTSGCDPNAACTNTAGGYSCRCFDGYAGDGYSCQATPELKALQQQYSTDGAARLACNEGQNIVYPEGAPGFQYDLTGALDRVKNGGQQNGFGSRSAVEPISCMIACNAAPGCDSFAYNPSQEKCFLKSGATRSTCRAAETVCVSARGKPYSCGVWQTYFKQGAGDTVVAANSSRAASQQLAAVFGQRRQP